MSESLKTDYQDIVGTTLRLNGLWETTSITSTGTKGKLEALGFVSRIEVYLSGGEWYALYELDYPSGREVHGHLEVKPQDDEASLFEHLKKYVIGLIIESLQEDAIMTLVVKGRQAYQQVFNHIRKQWKSVPDEPESKLDYAGIYGNISASSGGYSGRVILPTPSVDNQGSQTTEVTASSVYSAEDVFFRLTAVIVVYLIQPRQVEMKGGLYNE